MKEKDCKCDHLWGEFNKTLEESRGQRSALIKVLHKAWGMYPARHRFVSLKNWTYRWQTCMVWLPSITSFR